MIVVSDASPIINLAAIDQLDLLRRLYEQVVIPGGVFQEIVENGDGEPGAREVRDAGWIQVREVQDDRFVAALRTELDMGESEAIALALELEAELLLMDERRGRHRANHLGLRITGLLGVLLHAKQAGLINAVAPLLDALRERAGFWLGEELYVAVLASAEEG